MKTKTSEIRSDNMTTTRQNDVSIAYCNCSSRNEVNKHELPRDDVVEKKTWNILSRITLLAIEQFQIFMSSKSEKNRPKCRGFESYSMPK